MNILFTILLIGFFSFAGFTVSGKPAVSTDSCHELGLYIGNRFEAIEKLQNTDFDFVQEFKTLNLLGVRKATFYSCGAGNGYMIVESNRQPEVYRNVPQDLWEHWKVSSNIDYFFKRYIRNNGMYMYR